MLEGKGKIVNRPTETGGKKYDNFYVHLPTQVVRDSGFPFKIGEKVLVKIDLEKKRVVICSE